MCAVPDDSIWYFTVSCKSAYFYLQIRANFPKVIINNFVSEKDCYTTIPSHPTRKSKPSTEGVFW